MYLVWIFYYYKLQSHKNLIFFKYINSILKNINFGFGSFCWFISEAPSALFQCLKRRHFQTRSGDHASPQATTATLWSNCSCKCSWSWARWRYWATFMAVFYVNLLRIVKFFFFFFWFTIGVEGADGSVPVGNCRYLHGKRSQDFLVGIHFFSRVFHLIRVLVTYLVSCIVC